MLVCNNSQKQFHSSAGTTGFDLSINLNPSHRRFANCRGRKARWAVEAIRRMNKVVRRSWGGQRVWSDSQHICSHQWCIRPLNGSLSPIQFCSLKPSPTPKTLPGEGRKANSRGGAGGALAMFLLHQGDADHKSQSEHRLNLFCAATNSTYLLGYSLNL